MKDGVMKEIIRGSGVLLVCWEILRFVSDSFSFSYHIHLLFSFCLSKL